MAAFDWNLWTRAWPADPELVAKYQQAEEGMKSKAMGKPVVIDDSPPTAERLAQRYEDALEHRKYRLWEARADYEEQIENIQKSWHQSEAWLRDLAQELDLIDPNGRYPWQEGYSK